MDPRESQADLLGSLPYARPVSNQTQPSNAISKCVSLLQRIEPGTGLDKSLDLLSSLFQTFMKELDNYSFGTTLTFQFRPEPLPEVTSRSFPITTVVIANSGESTSVMSLTIAEEYKHCFSFAEAVPEHAQLVVVPADTSGSHPELALKEVTIYACGDQDETVPPGWPSMSDLELSLRGLPAQSPAVALMEQRKHSLYDSLLKVAQLASLQLTTGKCSMSEAPDGGPPPGAGGYDDAPPSDARQSYLVVQASSDIPLELALDLPCPHAKVLPEPYQVPQAPFPGDSVMLEKLWDRSDGRSFFETCKLKETEKKLLFRLHAENAEEKYLKLSPLFMLDSESAQGTSSTFMAILQRVGMRLDPEARRGAFFAPHEYILRLSLGGFVVFGRRAEALIPLQVYALNNKLSTVGHSVSFAGPQIVPATQWDETLEFFRIPPSSPLGRTLGQRSGREHQFRIFTECAFVPPGNQLGRDRLRFGTLCFRDEKRFPGLMVYYCFHSERLRPCPGGEAAPAVQPPVGAEDRVVVQVPAVPYDDEPVASPTHRARGRSPREGGADSRRQPPLVTVFKVHQTCPSSGAGARAGGTPTTTPSAAAGTNPDVRSRRGARSVLGTTLTIEQKAKTETHDRVRNVLHSVLVDAVRAVSFKARKGQSAALEEFMDSIFGAADRTQDSAGAMTRSSMAKKVMMGLDDWIIQTPVVSFYTREEEQGFGQWELPQVMEGLSAVRMDLQPFAICRKCDRTFWRDSVLEHVKSEHAEVLDALLLHHEDPECHAVAGRVTYEALEEHRVVGPYPPTEFLHMVERAATRHASGFVTSFHDSREQRGHARCDQARCQCSPHPEDVAFIHMYTQQSPIFRECNAAMRSLAPGRYEPWKPYIVRLSLSLHSMPRFKGTVYRGIASTVEALLYAPDNLVVWHAFSSSSKSSEVAETFLAADNTNSTLFVIESRTGCLVSPLSDFTEEAEVLFPPNSVFRVKGGLNQGVLALLSEAMKRDLRQVKCYNLAQVVDFESGLTASEYQQLEPLVTRLRLKKEQVRRMGDAYREGAVHVADATVEDVFSDCLRMYPGPMRLLAHEYGPGHVLYVALVRLRTYQRIGTTGMKLPVRVAAEVLFDLLMRLRDEKYVYEDKPPGGKLRQYHFTDFLSYFAEAAWEMGDIYAIYKLLQKDVLRETRRFTDLRQDRSIVQWIGNAAKRLLDMDDMQAIHNQESRGQDRLCKVLSNVPDSYAGSSVRKHFFEVVGFLFKSTGRKRVSRESTPVPSSKYLAEVLQPGVTSIEFSPEARGPSYDASLKADLFLFQLSSLSSTLEAIGALDRAKTAKDLSLDVSVEVVSDAEIQGLLALLDTLYTIHGEVSMVIRLLVSEPLVKAFLQPSEYQSSVMAWQRICGKLRAMGSQPPRVFRGDPPYENLLRAVAEDGDLALCQRLVDCGISLDTGHYPFDEKDSGAVKTVSEEMKCGEGHELTKSDVPKTRRCVKCDEEKADLFHSCTTCDYNICEDCEMGANGQELDFDVVKPQYVRAPRPVTLLQIVIESAITHYEAKLMTEQKEEAYAHLIDSILLLCLSTSDTAMVQGAGAALNHVQVLRLLLSRGFDPRTHVRFALTGPEVMRPLAHVALLLQRQDTLDLLLEECGSELLSDVDATGCTLLYLLTEHLGEARCNRFMLDFLEKNQDREEFQEMVDRPCGELSLTPLHCACSLGCEAAVEILIKMGAPTESMSANGETPIFSAVHSLRLDIPPASCIHIIQCLLKANADSTKVDAQGNTLLHACSHYCSMPVFDTLYQQLNGNSNRTEATNLDHHSVAQCACGSKAAEETVADYLWHLHERGLDLTGVVKRLANMERRAGIEALAKNCASRWVPYLDEEWKAVFLHVAAHREPDEVECFRPLASRLIAARNSQGQNVVHIAVRRRSPDVLTRVKRLFLHLKKEWDELLREYDHDGNAPIHIATVPNCCQLALYDADQQQPTTAKQTRADLERQTLQEKLRLLPEHLLYKGKEVPCTHLLDRFAFLVVIYGAAKELHMRFRHQAAAWQEVSKWHENPNERHERCPFLFLCPPSDDTNAEADYDRVKDFPWYCVPCDHATAHRSRLQEMLLPLKDPLTKRSCFVGVVDSAWEPLPKDFLEFFEQGDFAEFAHRNFSPGHWVADQWAQIEQDQLARRITIPEHA